MEGAFLSQQAVLGETAEIQGPLAITWSLTEPLGQSMLAPISL